MQALCLVVRTRARTCQARQQRSSHSSTCAQRDAAMPMFTVKDSSVAYKRYLTVFDRTVEVTASTGEVTQLSYDVVGHPKSNYRFAVILPFHPATSTTGPQVTVIREYCQGPDEVCFNLPTGGFDAARHATIEDCARAELSEEALLKNGDLIRLIPQDHAGFAEVKWCANRFVPYVSIDPQEDPTPGARDAEEFMTVQRMGLREFRLLVDSGDLMLPSVVTANLALRALEARGLIGPE